MNVIVNASKDYSKLNLTDLAKLKYTCKYKYDASSYDQVVRVLPLSLMFTFCLVHSPASHS